MAVGVTDSANIGAREDLPSAVGDNATSLPHDRSMQLSSTLTWLIDAATTSPGADRFLAELGTHLIEDGLPLAGGALTLAVPHPIIARRTWLWRAGNGEVIEAVGFAGLGSMGQQASSGDAGRRWLAGLASGAVHQDEVGAGADRPVLGWIGPRPFTDGEIGRLREAARFAAAPLAALSARATLATTLEAYLGRRSAARVLAGPLRRDVGETIRAALLYADLRNFTALSEAAPPADVIAALDAWFDCMAGSVHAFGGEVLKFIGDGMLAIFPVTADKPREACDAALRAVSSAQAGMAHLDVTRRGQGLPSAGVRRSAASRRNSVGQCRRGRPAGFHRDRSRRQSGQPARGSLPAARPHRFDFRRGRHGSHRQTGAAGNTCAARHRGALRRLHGAGRLAAGTRSQRS